MAGGGFDFLWKQVHDEGRKKREETGEQWLMDDQMEMHMERQTDAQTGVQTGAQTGGPEQADIRREERRRRRRLAAEVILILLFTFGIVINESDFLGQDHTTVVQYLEVYSTFPFLLAYIVPFCLVMKYLCSKYEMHRLDLLIAGFCGAFIPAALAGNLNDAFADMMSHLMGHLYSDAWIGSAGTGILEELLKLGTTGLLLYVLGRRSLKDYLGIGMCVGIGFQIEEDLSYITESGFENTEKAFPTALDRVSASFGSHWAYAAVTAAGLYLIARGSGKHHRRKGYGLILLVMVDHFLYDTPLSDSLLINGLLTVAVVLPVLLFFQKPGDEAC